MKETLNVCVMEITIKNPVTGEVHPFKVSLDKPEEGGWLWYGSDSTEERRLGRFFDEIKENIETQLGEQGTWFRFTDPHGSIHYAWGTTAETEKYKSYLYGQSNHKYTVDIVLNKDIVQKLWDQEIGSFKLSEFLDSIE